MYFQFLIKTMLFVFLCFIPGVAQAEAANWDVSNDKAGFKVTTDKAGANKIIAGKTYKINEKDGEKVFYVALTRRPTGSVFIEVTSSDNKQGSAKSELWPPVSRTRYLLAFDSKNWNIPQKLAVIAKDNDIVGENKPYYIKFKVDGKLTQAVEYRGLKIPSIKMTNKNDDNPFFKVTTGLKVTTDKAGANKIIAGKTYEINEKDGEKVFYVALTRRPTGPVFIEVTSSDNKQGSAKSELWQPVSRTRYLLALYLLVFDSKNWNIPQKLVVIAKDNDIVGENKPYYIKFKVNGQLTQAVEYKGLKIPSIKMTNKNDDKALFKVTTGFKVTTDKAGANKIIAGKTYEINEKDGEKVFYVALTRRPTGPVFIEVTSSDNKQGSAKSELWPPVSRTRYLLAFDSKNWNIPQKLAVIAKDNDIVGENKPYYIKFKVDGKLTQAVEYRGLKIPSIKMTNKNDDKASVLITEDKAGANKIIAGKTYEINEKDGVKVFYVVLTRRTTDNVIVDVSSSDNAQVAVIPGRLTFHEGNWNIPRKLTVVAKDNDIALENKPYDIKFKVEKVNSAGGYKRFKLPPIKMTNKNDDKASVLITTDKAGKKSIVERGTYKIAEGDKKVFYVRLTSQPSAGVLALIPYVDTYDYGGSTYINGINTRGSRVHTNMVIRKRIIFNSENWYIPQKFILNAEDNNIVDPDIYYEVHFTIEKRAPYNKYNNSEYTSRYNYLSSTPLLIEHKIDDETPIFKVTTDKAGANKVIAGKSYEINEKDGEKDFYVLPAGPLIGPVSVEVIFIEVSSSDNKQGSVKSEFWPPVSRTKHLLTFDLKNWKIPHKLTVVAKDNDIALENKPYYIKFKVKNGNLTDGEYKRFKLPSIKMTNKNDDKASILVTTDKAGQKSAGKTYEIDEQGGKQVFYVALTSQPTGDVIVDVSSSDNEQGAVSNKKLNFNAKNWNTRQEITLTAKDNDIVGENASYNIDFTVDGKLTKAVEYKGLKIPSIKITNTDNDKASFMVTTDKAGQKSAGKTYEINEKGGKQVFYVALTGQPTGDVIVDVSSSDNTQAAVLPGKLNFNEGNWNTRQEVTLTAKDNYIIGKNASYNIDFTVDGKLTKAVEYKGLKIPSIKITNTDNDKASFMVTTDKAGQKSAGKTYKINEKGGKQVFYVALTSQPTGNVIVDVSSSDNTQAAVSNKKLNFNEGNWSTRQEVTLTAKDNYIIGENASYNIDFTVDGKLTKAVEYKGLKIPSIKITNTDNDKASFMVTTDKAGQKSAGKTYKINEKGGKQVFYVALTSQPKGDVIVDVSSSDNTQGSVSNKKLNFNEGNWNTRQEVTLTAKDNYIIGKNASYNIDFTVDGKLTKAVEYKGLKIPSIKITNTDNDKASFMVTTDKAGQKSAGKTYKINEKGGKQIFYVALTSQPKGDVIVDVSSSDNTQGAVSNKKLNFNAKNWNTRQEVTLTAKDNYIIGKNASYNIDFTVDGKLTKAVEYKGLKIPSIKITNTDNDKASFMVTTDKAGQKSAGKTYKINEKGGKQIFYVALTSQPKGDVIVDVSSSDNTQGSVSNKKLNFNAKNWNTRQEVTLTAKDNYIIGKNASYNIDFTVDGKLTKAVEYKGLKIPSIKITNTDNDKASFMVTTDKAGQKSAGKTYKINEKGGKQIFYVALTSQPKGDVIVDVSSSDNTQGSVSNKKLNFNAKNWNTRQEVTLTAKDNYIIGENASYNIDFTVDGKLTKAVEYKGLKIPSIKITNTDNDKASFMVTTDKAGQKSAGKTYKINEKGGKQIFYVALTGQPTGNVIVDVSSSDNEQGAVSNKKLNFNEGNWNTRQEVTLTAKDNYIIGKNASYNIDFTVDGKLTKAVEYKGLKIPSIKITNTDNDKASFMVTTDKAGQKSAGKTYKINEKGGKQIFYVALTSQPTGNVIVDVSSSDNTQAAVLPGKLNFNAKNWNTRQEVTLTAKDNYIIGKNASYNIDFTVDGKLTKAVEYKGLKIPSIKITNTDNDKASFMVTTDKAGQKSAGKTYKINEKGGKQIFYVALTSQPTGNVIVDVSSSDNTQAAVSNKKLNFNEGNWNTRQEVTLTAKDNYIIGKNASYNIDFTVDGKLTKAVEYKGLKIPSIKITNTDNDKASFMVTTDKAGQKSAGKTYKINEKGGKQVFYVALTSQPTGNVIVDVSSSDNAQGAVSNKKLNFNEGNWNTRQEVTLTAKDNYIIGKNASYNIDFTVDGKLTKAVEYKGLKIPSIKITNTDNDKASFMVTTDKAGQKSAGKTYKINEKGGKQIFYVALTSQPTGNVIVDVSSSDNTQGAVSNKKLNFNEGNWNTRQEVTLTAKDNYIIGKNASYNIDFTVDGKLTKAVEYKGLKIPSIKITNTDNDKASVLITTDKAGQKSAGKTYEINEKGGKQIFYVALTSQPTGDVIVDVSSSDNAQGSVSNKKLNFNEGNWSTRQEVTLTAKDNYIIGKNASYNIDFTVDGKLTKAVEYKGLKIPSIKITNTDNDKASFMVTEDKAGQKSAGKTYKINEKGGKQIFYVALTSQPTGDVIVDVSSSDNTQGSVSNKKLNFNEGNWSTRQEVTLTAKDNYIIGKNASYNIDFTVDGKLTKAVEYKGLKIPSIKITNTDNDKASFMVTTDKAGQKSAGKTYKINEKGGKQVFYVALTSQPTGNVIVDVSSSDNAQAAVSNKKLNFNEGNWNTRQEVTLTAKDNYIIGKNASYNIDFTVDGKLTKAVEYKGLKIPSIKITNTDNDKASVLITTDKAGQKSAGKTYEINEKGGKQVFYVALTSQPTGNVIVDVSSSDNTQGSVSNKKLNFNEGNWNTRQEVTLTAKDNYIIGKNASYNIDFTVDGKLTKAVEYKGLKIPSIKITNTDNDKASFMVTTDKAGQKSAGKTYEINEKGGKQVFYVALTSQPTGNVIVDVSSSDNTQGSVSNKKLNFNEGNWNTRQEVTLTAKDNYIIGKNASYNIDFTVDGKLTKAVEYKGLKIPSIKITNTDNDKASFMVTTDKAGQKSAGKTYEINEKGGKQIFYVALTSQPTGNVIVDVSSSDNTQGSVSNKKLNFNEGNWNTRQEVTLTAKDNYIIGKNASYNIDFTVDGKLTKAVEYKGLKIPSIKITNTDNDKASVLITEDKAGQKSAGKTYKINEKGGKQIFYVALTSQPTGDVIVDVSSSDNTQGAVSNKKLNFNEGNWNTRQEVTLTAKDNYIIGKNASYNIDFTVDGKLTKAVEYKGLKIPSIKITNTDNDKASFMVTTDKAGQKSAGKTYEINEKGGKQVFYVALTSQPTGNVIVDVSSSDNAQAAVSNKKLNFNAKNWSTRQEVTLTAKDNYIIGENASYNIDFTVDGKLTKAVEYKGLKIPSIKITNTDNDKASFMVTTDKAGQKSAGKTYKINEKGGKQVFYVALTSQPTGDVIVDVSSSDNAQGAVSNKKLNFNEGNWNTRQEVTLTAKDNYIIGKNASYNIDFTVDGKLTKAVEYKGLKIPSIKITNTDNDKASFMVTTDKAGQKSAGKTYKINEKGGKQIFYVALTSQPTGNVIVDVSSSDNTQAAVSNKKLNFNAKNWSTRQEVTLTAKDNYIIGENASYNIDFTVDGKLTKAVEYKGLKIPSIKITNTDNDKASFMVTTDKAGQKSAGKTYEINEKGGKQVFYVALTSQPTGNVIVDVSSSDNAQAAVSNKKLNFNAKNWSTRQEVTLTAKDNYIIGKNASYNIDFTVDGKLTKAVEYKGLKIPSIKITNTDNDKASFMVTTDKAGQKSAGKTYEINEKGGKQIFYVALTSQPKGDVIVDVSSSDNTQGSVSNKKLNFNEGNWNTRQEVTLTAKDNYIIGKNASYNIDFTVDGKLTKAVEYKGLKIPSIKITNTDNDKASFMVTTDKAGQKSAGKTYKINEKGGKQIFYVALTSQPTGNVIVDVSSSDNTQAAVSNKKLNFNAKNWSTRQEVTLTAKDNYIIGENASYNIDFTVDGKLTKAVEYKGLKIPSIKITNTDNDKASVLITTDKAGQKSAGKTYKINEKGGKQIFYVALTSQPTGNVIVDVSSSDNTQAAVSNKKLNFNEGNWNTRQEVTLTAKDNYIIGKNASYNIDFTVDGKLTKAVEYKGLKIPSIKITNTDNDKASFMVTTDKAGQKSAGKTYEINEKGGKQIFYVALTSQPKGDVIVDVSSSDNTQGSVSNKKLNFNEGNWNTRQEVTLTAKDNYIIGKNASYNIDFTVDGKLTKAVEYKGLKIPSIKITNTDNDKASVLITTDKAGQKSAGKTYKINEKGGKQIFYVALTSQPTGNVIVDVSSSDNTQAAVLPGKLNFNEGNWNTRQEVTLTAKDNYIIGKNASYNIDFTVDGKLTKAVEYKGLKIPSIKITNTDNDKASFMVTTDKAGQKSAGKTYKINEKGGKQVFYVALTSQPTGNVIVDVSSSDNTQGSVSNKKLNFNEGNWNTRQEVTLTAKDNYIIGKNASYNIDFTVDGKLTKAVEYKGLKIPSIKITNTDNDKASFMVTTDKAGQKSAGKTYKINEKGGKQVFYVALTSQPTGNVIVDVSSSDNAQGSVSNKKLNFNEGNWNTRQEVTLTAKDNYIIGKNASYNIDFTVDGKLTKAVEYKGLKIPSIKITNTDNDKASVLITEDKAGQKSAGKTYKINEKGGKQIFYVALTSQPKGDVIVDVSSSDNAQGSVSNKKLNFNAKNWNTRQEVTLTAKDNYIIGKNASYNIDFTVDGKLTKAVEYKGLKIPSIKITNTDNDKASVLITEDKAGQKSAGKTYKINEKGGKQVFYVALTGQPTGDVIVDVSSSDNAQGSVSNKKLNFNEGNWNTRQEVTLTAKDNYIIGKNASYNIDFTVDGKLTKAVEYKGLKIPSIKITNTDNDKASFMVTTDKAGQKSAGKTYEINEKGGKQIFYVALTSQPTGNVIVDVSSSDNTQGSVSNKKLNFNEGNWNTRQEVTLTAKDNYIIGKNASYNIDFTVDGKLTKAVEYKGLKIPSIKITNTDNDKASVLITEDKAGQKSAGKTYKINEKGGKQVFYVVLTSQPKKGDVTVNVRSRDNTQGEVLPGKLTFNASNWSTPKVFTVTAKDNYTVGENTSYNIDFRVFDGKLTNYAYKKLKIPSIKITNTDDDKASFMVTTDKAGQKSAGKTYEINEKGGKQVFYVALTSQPTGNVIVNVSSSDNTQAAVSNKKLNFNEGNWNTRQEVTLTAKDNYIIGENASYNIDFTVDGKLTKAVEYKGLKIPSIKITNIDDDLNQVGTITIVQKFDVSDRIVSYTSNSSKILNFDLKSENGVARKKIKNVLVGTYEITQEDLTSMGYGVTSIVCNDNDSVVELANRKVIINLDPKEDVECTFNTVMIREKTSKLIYNYLGNRNALLLSNKPGINSRIGRLGDGISFPGTISGFGGSASIQLPVNLAVNKNKTHFFGSLNNISNAVSGNYDAKHKWDIWTKGIISRFEGSAEKGTFGVLYGGADYVVHPNVLIGGIAQIDWLNQEDVDGSVGDVDGRGWMFGPYGIVKLNKNLYADLRVSWGRSNNYIKPLNTYNDNFRTSRWIVSAALVGDYIFNNWNLRPTFGFKYIKEKQEGYVDKFGIKIPGQEISQKEIELGPRISRNFVLDSGAVVTPWLEFDENVTFTQKVTKNSILASKNNGDNNLSFNIKLGVDIISLRGANFSISGHVGKINSDLKNYGVGISLTIPITT